MIIRSPAVMSTCLWVEKAMRYRADIFSPWEPVETMTSLFLGMLLMAEISTMVPGLTFRYPSSWATLSIFSMLRPVTATLRP